MLKFGDLRLFFNGTGISLGTANNCRVHTRVKAQLYGKYKMYVIVVPAIETYNGFPDIVGSFQQNYQVKASVNGFTRGTTDWNYLNISETDLIIGCEETESGDYKFCNDGISGISNISFYNRELTKAEINAILHGFNVRQQIINK